MAKRYHDSKESMGGLKPNKHSDHFNDERRHDKVHGGDATHYLSNKRLGEEYYGGHNERRRQEMQDAGMIHEDHGAIANLPQNFMIKPYPKPNHYLPEGLDDTISGIDHQMKYDGKQKDSHLYPKKV